MEFITTLASILGMAAAAAVSFAITFAKTMKAKQTVQAEAEVNKTEADKANARLAILEEIKKEIVNKELNLDDLHAWLKSRNGTAGGLKFELVVTAIKIFCLHNGFEYDAAELEELVKGEVAFTKTVNSSK